MSRGIPDGFVQELLNKIDIVDIVSGYVNLKRKGNKFEACCPFHNEKTPSFKVDSNKQLFHCFGCHEGGDVITFIRKKENLSFQEAIEYLADKAGITISYTSNSKADEQRQRQLKRHYEICKEAARYYYSMLARGNNKAVEYCKKRGISPQVVKRFGIGYALGGGDNLLKHLITKGFTCEEALNSGLARRNGKGAYYDFFFDRLMFPIMDRYGNVIAFGGRVLGDGLPKYLNSSDSPVYNKKRHLYGLNIAKKNNQTSRLILVEGYMDVVTVSSFGIGGAVASLGTSLTKEQCFLIKRTTNEVYIAYDGDSAGKKAAVRASKMLIDENIMPRILVFNKGLDPDEFLKQHGKDEFEILMENAVSPYRFEIDFIADSFDLSNATGRRDFGVVASRIAANIKNELDKEDMLEYLAVKTGYSVETLRRHGARQYKMEENSHNSTQMPIVPEKDDYKAKAEALALKLALNGRRDEILLELSESDFDEPVYKECFRAIKDGISDEKSAIDMFEDDDRKKRIVKIIAIPDEYIEKQTTEECIERIRNEQKGIELKKCYDLLKSNNNSKEETMELLSKISELQGQLKHNRRVEWF